MAKKKQILEKYITAMKPKKHPKYIEDSIERRAYAYWRWAFEKIKKRADEKKHLEFQKANVQQIGGENLEESFDSDQSANDLADQHFDANFNRYAAL